MPLKYLLHVEDDPDIRTIAELALVSVGGLEVTQCASGMDGLAAAADRIPDLVLLDVMMPGLDGPETLRRLRMLPGMDKVPTVFMTAKVQPEEVSRYQALGVVGVIAKPFDPLTLADQVRKFWNQAQTTSSGR